MDFSPYFKVHKLVSVHPKSIIPGQMTNLNMIFHVVVLVYQFVKTWNLPQFPAEFRNGQLVVFKFVLSWCWSDTTSVDFYSNLFLHFFQKPKIKKSQNIHLKRTVLSNLLEVTVHVCIVSSSTFLGPAARDSAWKSEFFCMGYILKTKQRSTKAITQWCFSCPNKSVCQKLGWSCKKWKSIQKAIYALFFKIAFNYSQHCICIEWTAIKKLLSVICTSTEHVTQPKSISWQKFYFTKATCKVA